MGRRRASGDGSIYFDGERWRASIDLGWQNGKRRRKQLSGKTRKEVADKLRAAQKDQEAGRDLGAAPQTLADFLQRWLDTIVTPSRKPRTVESYRQLVRLYIEPRLGKVRLDKLNAEQVQAALNAMSEDGLSARTVQYVRAVLRAALDQAVRWSYVSRNVAAVTTPPRDETKKKMKPLTIDQARRLIEAVKGHRLEALYRVALSFGLRRGEVLGLLWRDVDLDKGMMKITGQVQEVGGTAKRVDSTKTDGSVRELPLPKPIVAVLRTHWKLQQAECNMIGVEWKEHGLVFPSDVGTPMWPRNLVRHFKTVLKAAGLPETTRFHDLRHSAATIMLAQGVPLKTVSDILGHASIQITADIYGHTDEEQKRSAADKIAGLFGDDEESEEPTEETRT
jgi:integrase